MLVRHRKCRDQVDEREGNRKIMTLPKSLFGDLGRVISSPNTVGLGISVKYFVLMYFELECGDNQCSRPVYDILWHRNLP